jgi:hypothetical protein
MDETADIPPEKFRSEGGFRSVQCWIGRGGLRIVGFRGAQSKIPGKLQNALRALKFKDGRWQMFLRDHTCETGSDFPVYTWQNGCWEMVQENPSHHISVEQNRARIVRSQVRSERARKNIGIRSGLAEPSALDRKPSAWKRSGGSHSD